MNDGRLWEPTVGELAEAVVRREFVVHYQPQIEAASGDVLGIEALVRWEHPERGLVLPGEFVALAEKTGLIEPMTDQVLDAALAASQGLAHDGHVLHMGVNVSAPSLMDARLPERVMSALNATGVPPSRLQLEITESSIMQSPESALDALGRLRSLGVGLALDDFGTGYSSLARLQTMPVNQVKIDRSFLAGLRGSHESGVLSLIVDLGRHLGHQIVAEGAETLNEVRTLTGMGCDVIQGFYFCRPLPLDVLRVWLDRNRDERLAEVLGYGRAARRLRQPTIDRQLPTAEAWSMAGLYQMLDEPLAGARGITATAETALSILGRRLGCRYGAWWLN